MKILIAGDFCPQNRVSSLLDDGKYEAVLGDIKPINEQADYSIVNFECPIIYGGEKPIIKCGPNLSCSKKGLEAVKWAGFDCITLANNHFLDYGEDGVENTISACKEIGLDNVGGGATLAEATRILYKEIKGSRVGIINCCEHEFSIATETTAGSNPLNPIQQYYAIREARNNAEYVLVIVHGGHEHFQLPSPRMQELYRFFVDAGADAVVNHHQHCFSGFEIYNNKPIIYGLGNFFFFCPNETNGIWNDGCLAILSFGESIDFELVPYTQCTTDAKVSIVTNREGFENKITELNGYISDDIKLRNAVIEYYKKCQNQYSNIFEPIRNRIYYALKSRGWLPSFISKKRKIVAANFIGCESHRDKVLFFLNHNQ